MASSSPEFRIKGVRWEITYKAKFDKHELYNHIRSQALRLKRNPIPSVVYIGHLTQNGEGYTRVLIKLGSPFDCKDKDRFVYYGVNPFIRAIYKKMWNYTVNELFTLDRDVYPKKMTLEEENDTLGIIGSKNEGHTESSGSKGSENGTKDNTLVTMSLNESMQRIEDLERTVLDSVKSINYLHKYIEQLQSNIVRLGNFISERNAESDGGQSIAVSPIRTMEHSKAPSSAGMERSVLAPIITPVINPDVGVFFVNIGDAADLCIIKSKDIIYETKSVILMGVTREWSSLKEKLSTFIDLGPVGPAEQGLFESKGSDINKTLGNNAPLFLNIMETMVDRCSTIIGKTINRFYNVPITLVDHPLKFNLAMLGTSMESGLMIVKNSDINQIKKNICSSV